MEYIPTIRHQYLFVISKKTPLFRFEILQNHRYLHFEGRPLVLIDSICNFITNMDSPALRSEEAEFYCCGHSFYAKSTTKILMTYS